MAGVLRWSSVDVERACEEEVVEVRVRLCPTRTPEVHGLGEFPLSCYACHVEADG